MIENYTVRSRVRRFSKTVAVLRRGNITVNFVEDGLYAEAYEKLFDMIEKSKAEELFVSVAYLDSSSISFLCKTIGGVIPLNYYLETGFFERDSYVLKRAGISKQEIKKALSKAGERLERRRTCLYRIKNGVAVLVSASGEKIVKIRHN